MLKLEVIKKIILIPLIISTAFFSIEIMLYGLVLFSLIEFFINSWYTKKLINYSIIDQMKDITPFLIISFTTFLSMYLVSLLKLSLLGMIISQILIGVFIFFLINERLKLNEYLEVKSKISSTINKVINWKK